MKVSLKKSKLGARLLQFDRRLLGAIEQYPFITCLWAGVLMNLVIYCLHARGLVGGLANLFSHFGFFIFNSLIIITTYSLSLLFKRRLFVLTLVTILWLALGVTDCVLLGMRVEPLAAIDFYIIRTGLAIVHVYLSIPAIIAIAVAILAVLALLVWLFVKCPRSHPDYIRNLLTVICCLLALLLLTLAVVGLADADPNSFEKIKDAYDVYGFPYCFLRGVFDRGIEKPEEYSEKNLALIVSELAARENADPEITPNVIFVQLESFFDVKRMKELTFSADPIPNFTALCLEGASGLLSVSSIGAGTANTEFEVLTGLDLEFFGTGEYPYQSILSERCCETVAYDLAALGYSTHGMHNHTGTFYDRYTVYANLGFDTFTGAEHMKNIEYNELDWEKDKVLTDYILKALTSTEGSDFIFAVSVQGHGGYPEIPLYDQEPVITLGGIDSEERKNAFQYYVNQLYEMDMFIGELCAAIEALAEDTVVVFYGDHLPAIDITESELENGDLFATDYAVWSNFGLTGADRDMEAYQLFSAVMEMLDIETGLVNKIHQKLRSDENYRDILQLVGYDMLYGDRLAFADTYPYTPRSIRLGLEDIIVTGVEAASMTDCFILGENFTPASHVFINGDKIETLFLTENSLFIEGYIPEEGDVITVVQISVDLRKLSSTEAYTVTGALIP